MEKTEKGKENLKRIGAFICYIFVVISMLPIWDENTPMYGYISFTRFIICMIALVNIFIMYCADFYFEKICNIGTSAKNWDVLLEELKKIGEEIVKFMLVKILDILVINVVYSDIPQNQESINELFLTNPVYVIVSACFFGPIGEEIIFRYFPRKFIKNNVVFILITGIIFAALHCITDLQYILMYLIPSIYFGYRYAKTDNDLFVPVSLHIFSNIVAVILMYCI